MQLNQTQCVVYGKDRSLLVNSEIFPIVREPKMCNLFIIYIGVYGVRACNFPMWLVHIDY